MRTGSMREAAGPEWACDDGGFIEATAVDEDITGGERGKNFNQSITRSLINDVFYQDPLISGDSIPQLKCPWIDSMIGPVALGLRLRFLSGRISLCLALPVLEVLRCGLGIEDAPTI